MRNIRAMYNKAIDYDIVGIQHYPFRRFKIRNEKTIKRNLSVEDLRKIIQAKGLDKKEELARDIFTLSFSLIGMNTVDIFNLRHQDVSYGRIQYHRRKTNGIYDIKIPQPAQEIINKYKGKDIYLLRFHSEYSDYRNFAKIVNRKLKKIAGIPITMYYARHTWATLASELDVPEKVISHALGHGNNSVTDIYINFDTKKVDQANEAIHNYVYGHKDLKVKYKKAF